MSTNPVQGMWERFQARDWEGAAELIHEDFVGEWPNTAERMEGRDNYLAVQRAYPEGWTIEVRRVIADGDQVAAEVRVPHGDELFHCAGFYEVREGKVLRATEYWSDGVPGEAPTWRAEWIQPL